jgi:uncharacterized membrane protein
MHALTIFARFVHIGAAAYWVGAMFFINAYLGPSVEAIDPEGRGVMQELARRRYFEVIMLMATLTILSGLYLVWLDSDGFRSAWFGTRFGVAVTVGMAASILAFVVAIVAVRPALARVTVISQQMTDVTSRAERHELVGALEAARGRMSRAGALSTLLLVLAVATTAVARYL